MNFKLVTSRNKRLYEHEAQQVIDSALNLKYEIDVYHENSYENKCSICLQTMKNKNKIQTSCNHTFCFDCIEYNRKHNKHTGDQCSICRNKIFD